MFVCSLQTRHVLTTNRLLIEKRTKIDRDLTNRQLQNWFEWQMKKRIDAGLNDSSLDKWDESIVYLMISLTGGCNGQCRERTSNTCRVIAVLWVQFKYHLIADEVDKFCLFALSELNIVCSQDIPFPLCERKKNRKK